MASETTGEGRRSYACHPEQWRHACRDHRPHPVYRHRPCLARPGFSGQRRLGLCAQRRGLRHPADSVSARLAAADPSALDCALALYCLYRDHRDRMALHRHGVAICRSRCHERTDAARLCRQGSRGCAHRAALARVARGPECGHRPGLCAASGGAGEQPYVFDNLRAGRYAIVAGTDNDNDGAICDPGEACGLFPDFNSFDAFDLSPGDSLPAFLVPADSNGIGAGGSSASLQTPRQLREVRRAR